MHAESEKEDHQNFERGINRVKKTHAIIFALISFIIMGLMILCTGCGGGSGGGGGSVGGGDGFIAPTQPTGPTAPVTPVTPVTTGGRGSFHVKINAPHHDQSSQKSKVIPYDTESLQVVITGDGIPLAVPVTGTIPDISVTQDLTIPDIPTGSHIATITLYDGDGTIMAQRKHCFYLRANTIEDAGNIDLGVALMPDGTGGYSASPDIIDVPIGTTLFFENWDDAYGHAVTVADNYHPPLTLGCAAINEMQEAVEPNTPASYSFGTILFANAGFWKYTGADYTGNASARILTYDVPKLTSITPPLDLNHDTDVSFSLVGTCFGTSQDMVDGTVQFFDINTGLPAGTVTITAWGDQLITGIVNIPESRYRVVVTVRGQDTIDLVDFTSGDYVELETITPDTDSSNASSLVSFTLDGTHFGTQGAPSKVEFRDVDTGTVVAATIATWTDTQITGTVTIPGGKWLVIVTDNHNQSTIDDVVYFYKGVGSWTGTVQ
jgi:hypothetical protein